jgi:ribonucleoside-diphosphate reductase beta chain
MTDVINLDNIIDDITNRKLFFGVYSGFQRYDVYKYPFLKKIEEKMRNAFWNPNEISMNTDRIKFNENLPEHAQDVIVRNLLFQTLMDSVQSRGLELVLAELTTSPELEAVFKTQAYFEQIHSLSYSHIIREVFPNATEIFDKIKDIPEITNRLEKEAQTYNAFSSGEISKLSEDVQKKHILELVLRIYFLEGLKFYVSFLVTYIINQSYNSAIQGITKIIKLINFDEDMHVSVMGGGILGILKKNKDEGFQELFENGWAERTAHEIVKDIVEDEINWGKYLISFGNIPTLTTGVFENFVKWWANERLEKIGFQALEKVEKIDIIDWFNMYRDIDSENVAQQEAEALAYNIGIMKHDIPEGKIEI